MEDDFVTVTDALVKALGAQAVADALGVGVQTYRQMRQSPETDGHRRPPTDWRERLSAAAPDALAKFGGWKETVEALVPHVEPVAAPPPAFHVTSVAGTPIPNFRAPITKESQTRRRSR